MYPEWLPLAILFATMIVARIVGEAIVAYLGKQGPRA